MRLVSPNGNSWVTVSAERAVRLREYGFRPVKDEAKPESVSRAPRKRAPRKAAG